jgi:hypothetical protein
MKTKKNIQIMIEPWLNIMLQKISKAKGVSKSALISTLCVDALFFQIGTIKKLDKLEENKRS